MDNSNNRSMAGDLLTAIIFTFVYMTGVGIIHSFVKNDFRFVLIGLYLMILYFIYQRISKKLAQIISSKMKK
ncbi:hypothetical protein [Lysinibacillus sp. 54212]|uniref:hypothetical protein n=1 Tax=Lysinibacillus sp. 54212 TaxID=3119829 RepID=UPI002FC90CAA